MDELKVLPGQMVAMEKAFEIASNSSDFRKAVEGLTKNF